MRAFTLVEMIIVLGLVGMIASLVAFQNLSAYSRLLGQTDGETIRSSLIKARSDAMNGVCTGDSCEDILPHGIRVTKSDVTIFEGTSYDLRVTSADQLFPLDDSTASSTFSSEYVVQESIFTPVTGAENNPSSLVRRTTSGALWNIHINEFGTIELMIGSIAPATTT
jgi:prepilin-type N-terminal cleavage/methylation domain-containing protein